MKPFWNTLVLLRVRNLGLAKIVQNSFYLYVVLLANQIIPLITFPYLVRTLGAESFGKLAIGQSILFYLVLLIEFGTNLHGTREVAKNRMNKILFNQIFVLGLASKSVTLCISLVFSLFLSLFIEINFSLFVALLCNAIATVISPYWVFQGIERMDLIAYLEVAIRISSALGIFWLVQDPSASYTPILITGISSIAIYVLGNIWLIKTFGLQPRCFTLEQIGFFLHASRHEFLFRLLTSLYTAGNPIILSFFVSPDKVGIYAAAEKVIKMCLSIFNPIIQSFYPRLSKLVSENRNDAVFMVRILFVTVVSTSMIVALAILIFAPNITILLLGRNYLDSTYIMQILATLIPLIAMSGSLAIPWMLALQMGREFNIVASLATVLNLVLAPISCFFYGSIGMAWTWVLVELFVTISMIVILWHYRSLPLFIPSTNHSK